MQSRLEGGYVLPGQADLLFGYEGDSVKSDGGTAYFAQFCYSGLRFLQAENHL